MQAKASKVRKRRESATKARPWAGPARRILRILLLAVLAAGIVGGGLLAGFLYSSWRDLPALSSIEPRLLSTSFLYDRNGEQVTGLIGPENRIPVTLADIPQSLKDAFIAREDCYFYTHRGFVVRSIIRAAYQDIFGGSFQGGSTITQQLARTAFLSLDQTMKRKVQELILSLQLERSFTKNEILEMYLNQIPLGHGGYGVQAAATNYFNKHVSQLTLAESAMIAGMAKSPGRFSPYVNLEQARRQQHTVLAQMVKYDYIDQAAADAAYAEELVLTGLPSRTTYPYPFFVDYVLDQLLNVHKLDPELIYSGGLRIYSTLDQPTQTAAEAGVAKYAPNLPRKDNDKGESAEVGLVIMENETGYLRAIVGGVEHRQKLQFNFATQSKRQPGSAFKPIVDYTPAIDLGYGPATLVDDAPVVLFTLSGESWTPSNVNSRFVGLVNFRTALEKSINTAAARVLNMIGIRTGIDYARRMGITSLVTEGTFNDVTNALALGALTNGVSPLELTRAYAVLGNRGVKVQPLAVLRVEDRFGHVLVDNQPRREVILSEQTAWLMSDILTGVIHNAGGTGWRAKLNGDWIAAGKTGTSEDSADAWFAGYTALYSGTVWLGYPKERISMGKVQGGMYPALMWKEAMDAVHAGLEPVGFERPKDIVDVAVCKKSGKLPGPNCPAGDIGTDVFLKGTEPTEVCTTHVSARVCLGDEHSLAGPNCPPELVVWRTFIRRPEPYFPWITSEGVALVPQDAGSEVPQETCRVHSPPEPFVPDRVVEVVMNASKYDPAVIQVSHGNRVRLALTAVDQAYGFALQGYGVSALCPAGQTVTLDFVADRAGTFYFFCNMDIGDTRSKMVGRLVVN
ncbi:MAG: PBP1A family penicillin-binding protein [Bacillota bacterium]|nr:PBP1A family penicillin-binding protein [Bacillota bacterium]